MQKVHKFTCVNPKCEYNGVIVKVKVPAKYYEHFKKTRRCHVCNHLLQEYHVTKIKEK